MTDTPDPGAIAASLGRYERSALLRLSNAPQGGYGQMWLALLDNRYLADRTEIDGLSVYHITTLGRAVSAAIRERE